MMESSEVLAHLYLLFVITGHLPREEFNCMSIKPTVTNDPKPNDDVTSNQGLGDVAQTTTSSTLGGWGLLEKWSCLTANSVIVGAMV